MIIGYRIAIDHMTKLWLSYHTTNLWRFMIIIIFFENMVT